MNKSVILNCAEIATPLGKRARYGAEMNDIKKIHDGAIYIEGKKIKKIGNVNDVISYIDKHSGGLKSVDIIDAKGKAVIPGFVDSHTHFLFGGYREEEFINRLSGMEYLEIMKLGGGIQSTVNATRKESKEELKKKGRMRLLSMLSQGITTVEGKSGYGLDEKCELKMLRIMKELNAELPIDIISTYLGGHAPSDLFPSNEKYIDFMVSKMLPYIKKNNLAEFCDIFCEDSVFSIEESRKLLSKAKEQGFLIKLHADEIVSLGGAQLAGDLKAISADHLLMISNEGVKALRENRVIATLLPCTAFCLNKEYAPARSIIDGGGAVALASDLNPGSCFANSIALMLALAVINMKMSIEEALCALTLNGAAAVNKADSIGSIEEGKNADLLILDYPSYKFLVYHTGTNIVNKVIKNGELVYEDKLCK